MAVPGRRHGSVLAANHRLESRPDQGLHGVSFARDAELTNLLHSYIPYYNGERLHSGIGYSSPIDYEARST